MKMKNTTGRGDHALRLWKTRKKGEAGRMNWRSTPPVGDETKTNNGDSNYFHLEVRRLSCPEKRWEEGVGESIAVGMGNSKLMVE